MSESLSVEFRPASMGVSFGNPVARELVDRDPYTGEYTVTPTNEPIVLLTDGKRMTDNVTVKAVTVPTETKEVSIYQNGELTEDVLDYAFARITVDVPQPSGTKQISISANGTTTHDVAAYESAQIEVAVPVPTLTSLTAVDNGTYTPAPGSAYSSVEVAIPSADGVSF